VDGERGVPRRRWWERVLFSFMGPPQLGDVNAPRTSPVDPQAEVCHRCGRPWSEHQTVRTSSRTYLTCPPAAPTGGL
jgi:hypothetical protein